VLVGSVSIPLQVFSPAASRSSPAAQRFPSGPRVGDEGDVALLQPSVSLGVVDPPNQCQSLPSPDPVRDLPGLAHVSQVGQSARSDPCNPLPYKWVWQPVGTLDLTLLIPTSI
jgi:hypothetical protein